MTSGSWYADHLESHDALHHLLLEHLEGKGYDLIDLHPPFAAAAAEGRELYWTYDTHMNARGNALAAEVVSEALKARGVTALAHLAKG